MLISTTDQMGTKRILKPSEYEIEEFKEKCSRLKNSLLYIIAKYNNNNSIPTGLINQITD